MGKSGKRSRKKWYALAVVCVVMLLAAYLKVTPGTVRYYGLPQAIEQNGGPVMFEIKGIQYEWYGALEDDMKKGRLISYIQDDDGYYTEFYEIKGRDGLVIAVRRVIMGDWYVIREYAE